MEDYLDDCLFGEPSTSIRDDSFITYTNSIDDSFGITIKTPQQITVNSSNSNELSSDKILLTLQRLKIELMQKQLSFHELPDINYIACNMTSHTKENLLKASRRSKRYGMKPPIIARYDDNLRRLPDQLQFDTDQKMIINIVDSSYDGPDFLELVAIFT